MDQSSHFPCHYIRLILGYNSFSDCVLQVHRVVKEHCHRPIVKFRWGCTQRALPFEKTKRKRVIRKYVQQKGAAADPVETVLVIFFGTFFSSH